MAEIIKIIIADINQASVVSLKDLLTANGYSVEQADNGHEIIEKIRSLRYDLAIVSADVADIDGYRICRLVKESERTRHIPIILMASYGDQSTRTEAMESGADEFMLKPINRAELLTRVYTLLNIKSLHDKLEQLIAEKEEEKKQLTRRTHELRILSDIARIVISIKDSQKALNEILNNIVYAFHVEAAALFNLRDDRWFLDITSDQCRKTPYPDFSPRMIALLEDVRKMEKTFILDESNADLQILESLSTQLGFTVHKALCSPVFIRGKVIGIIMIFNKKEGMIFEPIDISLLMTITGQIALAIENIQLFDKLSGFNKYLQEQITESTKALLDLKNFNESILQNISSGIITVDLSGKIIFANKAAEEILGVTHDELANRSLSDLFGDKASHVMIVTTRSEEAAKGDEIQLTIGDHKEIFLGYTTSVRFGSDEKPAGYIISFRDITHIKQMRDTIQRMDRLVSLGLLTGGIAHEIRNPLAGIKTLAQALEREIPLDDLKIEYIRRIIKQINRLNELLKAFFTYAKPGRPERQFQNLPSIIGEVKVLVKQRAHNDQIIFEENYDPGLPPLYVDGNQMEQVFLNLLINAMDAIGKNGKLSISAKPLRRAIPSRFMRDEDIVEVRISDTGAGIRPEDLRSIFDPFFTTKPNGVGLGLSIVYRIIHEHGGEINVESEPGKGTTFIIDLPLEDSHQRFDLNAIQAKLNTNGKILNQSK